MSDYILTHSKIRYNTVNPVKEDIHIEDIAHALSLMTRANGHFRHFYSVAQHSQLLPGSQRPGLLAKDTVGMPAP